jgi:hypothetical protein
MPYLEPMSDKHHHFLEPGPPIWLVRNSDRAVFQGTAIGINARSPHKLYPLQLSDRYFLPDAMSRFKLNNR